MEHVFVYTPGAIAALANHYFDDHEDVVAVDAYADYDAALDWLQQESAELHGLLHLLMLGHMEIDLAVKYRLKPRTLARLLDQVFLVMAQYLNNERPIILPNVDALRAAEGPPTDIEQLAVMLVSLSMTLSFYNP